MVEAWTPDLQIQSLRDEPLGHTQFHIIVNLTIKKVTPSSAKFPLAYHQGAPPSPPPATPGKLQDMTKTWIRFEKRLWLGFSGVDPTHFGIQYE